MRGALVLGAAGTLAACGGGDDGDTAGGDTAGGDTSGGDTSGGDPTGDGAATENVLGPASEVPVGGGKIYPDAKVVVTQPTDGTFKAFSAICTHEGCTVGTVEDGVIKCPCHGSQYSITDAAVVGGPAPKPLEPREVTVTDGTITLA